MRNLSFHWEDAHKIYNRPEAKIWLDRMADKGWVAPAWPAVYGGGGLKSDKALILNQEMKRIKATAPSSGMGLTMIGPTLLEFGSAEQKEINQSRWQRRHSVGATPTAERTIGTAIIASK